MLRSALQSTTRLPVLAVVLILVAGWQFGIGPQVVSSPADPGTGIPLTDVEAGWCLSSPAIHVLSMTVDRVGCDTPHLIEIVAIVDQRAALSQPYPGEDAMRTLLQRTCDNAYEQQFAATSVDHGLGIAILADPSKTFWENNDGQIRCGIYSLDLKPAVGNILQTHQAAYQ